MPNRQATLHIRVVDEHGRPRDPGSADRVFLGYMTIAGPLAPVEPYSSERGFVYNIVTADVEMVIKYQGFADLHQWFSMDAPSERPQLTPYWPGTDKDPSANSKRIGHLLSCIQISRTSGGSGGDRSPSVFTVTVTLYPMKEYVAAIGTDYWEGAVSGSTDAHRASLDFLGYSIIYADHLYASGELNPSSQLTMWNCQRGTRETWAYAQQKGWRRQIVLQAKGAAPSWPTASSFVNWYYDMKNGSIPATQYLGATDIYHYISNVGAYRPHTLVDFSIFSHAWAGGPILFNTYYDETARERTPGDLDMRIQDFIDPNVRAWPKMPDAFATTAQAVIWGCFATTAYRDMINYLRRTRVDSSELFKSTYPGASAGIDRNQVIHILNQTMDNNSYMKRFAQHVGRNVYGGPPGYGAEWIEYSTLPAIPATLKKKVKGKIMHVPGTLQPGSPVRKLYESVDLGARAFNQFGYMRYVP